MQRFRILGTDCRDYIVQNDNVGDPTGSTQILDVVANSFTIRSSSGQSPAGASAPPASFPSIYVGANGDVAYGTFSTWSDSGLPEQVNVIAFAAVSLIWSGGSQSGDLTAVLEAWFARTAPTAGSYDAAAAGSLMVWAHAPAGRAPVGSVKRQAVIGGQTWDVWVGPHGDESTGTDDTNRPVLTYVPHAQALSALTLDLKDFVDDAVANGAADMSAGGTSQAFSSGWYLTDVFGGLRIWTGEDAAGLQATFTCAIE